MIDFIEDLINQVNYKRKKGNMIMYLERANKEMRDRDR